MGVTVNDLICDSVTACRSSYIDEAERLLSDCTHEELKIISATMQSLKEQLRNK